MCLNAGGGGAREKSIEARRRQDSAFDNLCHAVVEVTLRQGCDASNVNIHARGRMECADDVLELHAALLHVHRSLASDGRVNARHESCGHLH